MRVVVVESPAKARTVGRFLGRGWRVLACHGHVRDLPAKAGSVKPDEGFAMVYGIRPAEVARTPESLDGAVEPDAVRLYALIRDRMLASQMAAAHSEKLEIVLATPGGEVALAAAGARLVFDGFLRVCGAEDREVAEDGTPPALDPGERVRIEEVRVARRLTAAPPRYTEAGLVGRLEALGIGRPSTWAVIVGVLRERGYAAIEGGCFAPLERGRVATAFLEEFFGRWVEYGFTAAMEEELDRIAGGEAAWKSVLGGFWGAFSAALEETGGLDRATVIAAVEERLAGYIYGTGGEPARRRCPACGAGVLLVKASRHGPFVGCGAWPACDYRRPLAAGSDAAARAWPKRLGTDPASGLAVTLRRGPHGHYIQLGGAGEAKPRRMSVPGGMDPDGIGLEAALKLLALPRGVGAHPASGQPILAGIGRYGPWVRHGATYAAIRDSAGAGQRGDGAGGGGEPAVHREVGQGRLHGDRGRGRGGHGDAAHRGGRAEAAQ